MFFLKRVEVCSPETWRTWRVLTGQTDKHRSLRNFQDEEKSKQKFSCGGICFQETNRMILSLCVTKGNYTITRGKKSLRILRLNQANCTIHFRVTLPRLHSTHAHDSANTWTKGILGPCVTKPLEAGVTPTGFLPRLAQIKASLCGVQNNQMKASEQFLDVVASNWPNHT